MLKRSSIPPKNSQFYLTLNRNHEISDIFKLEERASWVIGRQTPEPAQISNTHPVCKNLNLYLIYSL